MACKNICRLCEKLVLSQSITYSGTTGILTVNLPAGSYADGEKYCIVLAQAIPSTATINAPVVFTIGTGTTTFPLETREGQQVIASSIRTRTRYATRVVTTTSGGSFNLIGDLCRASATTLPAIDGTT